MSASNDPIYAQIQEAVAAIQNRCGLQPEVGVILGSGLGAVAQELTDPVRIAYTEIPHFHATSVEGHSGYILLGRMKGVPTVILQGRFHFYEGYSMQSVVLPTRVVCALGAHTLVLTNAAGGINTRYRPGDLMVIEDHINLMGDNPLKGPNLAKLGPRFPDLSEAYSKECVKALDQAAGEEGVSLHHGVYCGLLGPTYETPAEVRMLRTLGADAVGMSTVPEAIAANHLGVRVCGVSLITNLAAGLSPQKLSHEEVMENSKAGVEKLSRLLVRAIPQLTHRKKD
jgi:purine-nucleoside phosphorylase